MLEFLKGPFLGITFCYYILMTLITIYADNTTMYSEFKSALRDTGLKQEVAC